MLIWLVHRRFLAELQVLPLLVTFPQAFDLATSEVLCWLTKCTTFEADSSRRMTVIYLVALHLVSHLNGHVPATLVLRVWSESTRLSLCCNEIHQSFTLLLEVKLVSHSWWQLFGLFPWNVICDILIGWSYSGLAAREISIEQVFLCSKKKKSSRKYSFFFPTCNSLGDDDWSGMHQLVTVLHTAWPRPGSHHDNPSPPFYFLRFSRNNKWFNFKVWYWNSSTRRLSVRSTFVHI